MLKNVNIERTPLYFGEQGRSLFGWYHAPKNQQPHLAMVICPPIGHEYLHSHRTLRHLADELARAGIACLRFDYHGTGDSSGVDEDPLRVPSWLESIKKATFQVQSLSGCDKAGLIGFRIGATLATLIAEENDLACLVLWAPCIRGRNYCREIKALSMSGANALKSKDNSNIESAGFVLTEQTIEDLSTIDLHKITPRTNKILVVMRDDLAEASQRLDQWAEHEIHIDYLKFSGYGDIVAEPHDTKVPFDTIAKITDWANNSVFPSISNENINSDVTSKAQRTISALHTIIVHTTEDERQHINHKVTAIREEIFQFGNEKHLFGILSEPLSEGWINKPTIVLANSGANHHIGPNRLYVLLARNISRSGFRCLRMDLSGLGDSYIEDSSKENESYVSSATSDIDEALRSLQQDGTSFVVMGLCSGAHTAFHAALDLISQPIDECALINPLTFYWKKGMSLSTTSNVDSKWHYYKKTMRQGERWLKLFRGEADIIAIIKTISDKATTTVKRKLNTILRYFKLIKPIPNNLNDDLTRICHAGRTISFILSSTDPGYDILMSNAKGAVKKFTKNNLINVQLIQNADHTFSKYTHRIELTNKLIDHFLKQYP